MYAIDMQSTEKRKLEAIVKATWENIGCSIRALKHMVWVRTLPPPRKIGLIWMPAKQASFYGELAHLVTVQAVVLSAGTTGPAKQMKAGDVVAFKRLHFARYWRVESLEEDEYGRSEDYVGRIDSNDILGFVEAEDVRAIPLTP
jgi:hypothetical protein